MTAVRLLALTIDSSDPDRSAQFWADLLDREPTPHLDGVLLPGSATQTGLRFVETEIANATSGRTHLHVTSDHAESQQAVVERAVGLGATHLDVGQLPDEGHVVLADPDGFAFCVIEQGNNYLAGAGVLGEWACDGSRDVGVFWSEALDWPLVWDQDEETAIQSPAGGTKVAWGGPPFDPRRGRDAQRFELAVAAEELAAEVERLEALGARFEPGDAVGTTGFDPDGNEFRIVTT